MSNFEQPPCCEVPLTIHELSQVAALEYAGRCLHDQFGRDEARAASDAMVLLGSLSSWTPREIDRAVSFLEAMTTNGVLDNVPTHFLFGQQGIDVHALVFNDVLAHLSTRAMNALVMASFFPDGFQTNDLFDLLECTHVQGQALLDDLTSRRLIQGFTDALYVVVGPLRDHILANMGLDAHALQIVTLAQRLLKRWDAHVYMHYELAPIEQARRVWESYHTVACIVRVMCRRDATLCMRLLVGLVGVGFYCGSQRHLDVFETLLSALDIEQLSPWWQFQHHVMMAELCFRREAAVSAAINLLDQGLDVFDVPPDDVMVCYATRYTVYVIHGGMDNTRALSLLDQAIDCLPDVELPDFFQPLCLRMYSRVFLLNNDMAQASQWVERSLEVARAQEHVGSIVMAMADKASMLHFLKAYQEVESVLAEVLEMVDSQYHPRLYYVLHHLMGMFLHQAGEPLRAVFHLTECLNYLSTSMDTYLYKLTLQLLALCEAELGHDTWALEYQERVGWPLGGQPEQADGHWCVFVAGALVYAFYGHEYLARRMLLDAEFHQARVGVDEPSTWIVPYARAMFDVVVAVDANQNHQHALAQFMAVRQSLLDQNNNKARDTFELVMGSLERNLTLWGNKHQLSFRLDVLLRVDQQGACYQVNEEGVIDLSRRASLRQILNGLIDCHLGQEVDAMSLEDVFALGWPNENISFESMKARVYNTISRLRALGLGTCIVHDGRGYSIAPHVRVVFSSLVG